MQYKVRFSQNGLSVILTSNTHIVCKLKKSIYGLKQAARLWHEKLGAVLEGMNFKKTYSDVSVFIYNRNDLKLIVPVFVDDITI